MVRNKESVRGQIQAPGMDNPMNNKSRSLKSGGSRQGEFCVVSSGMVCFK